MLYIFLLFVVVCLFKIKFNKNGYTDYMDIKQTTCIRGIFAIIIFFSHFNKYTQLTNSWQNNVYKFIISSIGQLMVALFLFYSGYRYLLFFKER